MKMSRTITLKVLAGLTLTGCLAAAGCGGADERADGTPAGESNEPADHTWYDENGNPVPEEWATDAQGNRVLDGEGRPIPAHGVPRDRHGHLWVFHHGVWVPPVVVFGSAYRPAPVYSGGAARPGSWVTGGSGYRAPGAATPYRAPSGSGSAPVHAAAPARPSASSPPAGSSISRGGFGSTGSASSSSASS